MNVFVSYAREDQLAVQAVHDDLTRLGHGVWFDRDLAGGQAWWDTILASIRSCDVFLIALSPEWLGSRACKRELEYARAVKRPLLPVQVRAVGAPFVPEEIGAAQIVDLRNRGADSAIELVRALATIRPAQPLPDPLPDPPAAPMTSLGAIVEQLQAPSLGYVEQMGVVTALRSVMNAPEDRSSAIELFERLRARNDVVESIADSIDSLLAAVPPALRSNGSSGSRSDFARWPSVVFSISSGQCTPVLGLGLTDSLIGPRRLLARNWAHTFEFPLASHQMEDLPQVAQYVKVENDTATLRAALSQYLRQQVTQRFPQAVPTDLGLGHLDDMLISAWHAERADTPADPHRVLARLDLPIYITAHPTTLLASALREAGREPVVELCRWRDDLDDWPESAMTTDPTYTPSPERPLVFHLFGNLTYPDSLVLTEDDYFDFLMNVSHQRTALIPAAVLAALADSSLMFLGFGLDDWDFRVLLRSLVTQGGGRRRKNHSHVAAQIDLADGVASPQRARQYLQKYFKDFQDMTIDIFWGSVDEFVMQLEAERRRAAS
jgi:hypothetical protein